MRNHQTNHFSPLRLIIFTWIAMVVITVVGAGVVGLTSAYKLLQDGHQVTIIGRNIPGDIDAHYTSPFAGANWQSFGSLNDKLVQQIDKPAYLEFIKLADTDPTAAVHRVMQTMYVRKSQLVDGKVVYPWFASFVNKFSSVDLNDVADSIKIGEEQDPIVACYEYETVTITTSLYLVWLLHKVESKGGRLFRRSIKHIDEAYGLNHTGKKADIVVNCTGILASKLGGVEDSTVYPIRGQIVRVRNNFPRQIIISSPGYAGETFYAFPRKEGGGILGGSFLEGDWSTIVDPDLTQRILNRAKKYIPELTSEGYGNDSEIDVIEEYVGLRPGRLNGFRLEREGNIIHNYGIGGAGYQASYGLAERVVELVNEYIRQAKL